MRTSPIVRIVAKTTGGGGKPGSYLQIFAHRGTAGDDHRPPKRHVLKPMPRSSLLGDAQAKKAYCTPVRLTTSRVTMSG